MADSVQILINIVAKGQSEMNALKQAVGSVQQSVAALNTTLGQNTNVQQQMLAAVNQTAQGIQQLNTTAQQYINTQQGVKKAHEDVIVSLAKYAVALETVKQLTVETAKYAARTETL